MTGHLSVDDQGLNAAAACSAEVAAALASATAANPNYGNQASHAGVSEIDGALASARNRQAARTSTHAEYLRIGSGVYRHTSEAAADNITRTI